MIYEVAALRAVIFCIATSQAAAELARADIWRPHTIPEFIIKNSGDCVSLAFKELAGTFGCHIRINTEITTKLRGKQKKSAELCKPIVSMQNPSQIARRKRTKLLAI